eukprot:COSAG02_NODE_21102_length_802_cov_1.015647_2_plen_39_part_01
MRVPGTWRNDRQLTTSEASGLAITDACLVRPTLSYSTDT